MTDNKDNTVVQNADINLDELLGTPGAENIMVPENKTEEKPSIFQRKEVDLSFLDNEEDENSNNPESKEKTPGAEGAAGESEKGKEKISTDEFEEIINNPTDKDDDQESSKKGGRPNGLVELTNKLIEKGIIVPFDGDEDISKYNLKDFEELYEVNEKEKAKKLEEQISSEFFNSLPDEFKIAADYLAKGGTDLKQIFRSLAASQEIKALDVADPDSQEQIARSYLHATTKFTPEEIEEQIETWKDKDLLEDKANLFKPKLDAMQEQIIARQLAEQENLRRQQQAQAQMYTDNIYKTLEPGELNGIKLDKKTQGLLFSGLTQANYPSVSGRSTNLLGHLLEKYQYVEPRHDLISEALWLLADPEGYKAKVRDIAKKETVEKTVRQLKTEQSNKITSSSPSDEDDNKTRKTGGIPRPSTGGFFKR